MMTRLSGIARRVALSLARIALLLLVAIVVIRHFSPQFRTSTDVVAAALKPSRLEGVAELPTHQTIMMNWYLREIEKETGVDIRVVFTELQGATTVEHYAVQEAGRRGLGRRRGMRGVLIVYDRSAERIRMEVGYGLEGYFTDAFTGRLIEDHAGAFFRSGDVGLGMQLMARIIHERIRDELVGGNFDPTPFQAGAGQYVSGGAGASATAPLAQEGLTAFRSVRDRGPATVFDAQPTPAEAYQRLLDWLRPDGRALDATLFTPASRWYLASLPLSGPYFDHMLATIWNKRWEVIERGDVAMLYYTGTPLRTPMFMRRGEDGWQIDIAEEVDATRETIGSEYTWTLTGGGTIAPLFADQFVQLGRHVRVRAGDNRPLHRVR
jgi:uncharacterized protein